MRLSATSTGAAVVTPLAIGDPITDATGGRVLYTDPDGLLADSDNLKFDGNTLEGKTFKFHYDKVGDPNSYIEYHPADRSFRVYFDGNPKLIVTNGDTYCEQVRTGNISTTSADTGAAFNNYVFSVNDAGVPKRAYKINAIKRRFDLDNLALAASGADKRIGRFILVAGTATINTTAISSTAEVFLQLKTVGGTQGIVTITQVDDTSFTVTSDNALDTSAYSFQIIESF